MASVFQKFGGIRPMAAKIGVPSSTVKSWHAHQKIPGWRHETILAAAKAHHLEITSDDLDRVQPDEASATQDAA